MLEVELIEVLLSMDDQDGSRNVVVGSPVEEKVDRGSEVALRTAPELSIATTVPVDDKAADDMVWLDEPTGEIS